MIPVILYLPCRKWTAVLGVDTAGQQVQNILAYTQSYYTYYWDTIYRVQYFDEKDPMHTCHTRRWQAIIRMTYSPEFLWMVDLNALEGNGRSARDLTINSMPNILMIFC